VGAVKLAQELGLVPGTGEPASDRNQRLSKTFDEVISETSPW
jgi:hypothetical protein